MAIGRASGATGSHIVAGPGIKMSRAGLVMAVLAVVLAGWLALGLLRAEWVARDYYAGAHGVGATVVNVEARLQPALPPFWSVEIHGEVIEAGKNAPGYISAMILWVEPLTGWVIAMRAG